MLSNNTKKNATIDNSNYYQENMNNSNMHNEFHKSYNFSNSLSYINEKQYPIFYKNGTRLYTREYVLELKNIFEKEKQVLIFKNSLQNNIDRLKISFCDRIQELKKQIEQTNNKNTISKMDEKHNVKLESNIN